MDYVLHSDLNCFYASVEMVEKPELRSVPLAVCGSTEDRHGIVLTKNYLARPYGIKTGEAVWQAKQKCPQLVTVPPRYELYLRYSRLVREIYSRWTDRIEPFGMDECWLHLDACENIGIAAQTADRIRRTIREETGLTASVGVSFSKIYAKLGSDMKKPDATTVISRENYRSLVFPLPVTDLLYVGPATGKKLRARGILTIGDLAGTDPVLVRSWLGKNGLMLRSFAAGEDCGVVMPEGYEVPLCSIGHGATCIRDLTSNYEVWLVLLELSQDIGKRLRKNELTARGVELSIRRNDMNGITCRRVLRDTTCNSLEIAQLAYQLFLMRYDWSLPVRALTVRAIELRVPEKSAQQDLFGEAEKREKFRVMEDAVCDIRERFGAGSIRSASLLGPSVTARDQCETVPLPGMMYRQ